MGNTVVVADMVKGFLEPGHNLYCGDKSREIIPNVWRLLERERAAGSSILFVCDNHEPDDLEFRLFPVHCVKGTEETEVVPELQEFVTEQNVIPKNRYSGFFNTELDIRLKNLKPDKLILCGVCTDICVLHTANDAWSRDYQLEVPTDCVASFDPQQHEWALQHMQKILGASLV